MRSTDCLFDSRFDDAEAVLRSSLKALEIVALKREVQIGLPELHTAASLEGVHAPDCVVVERRRRVAIDHALPQLGARAHNATDHRFVALDDVPDQPRAGHEARDKAARRARHKELLLHLRAVVLGHPA